MKKSWMKDTGTCTLNHITIWWNSVNFSGSLFLTWKFATLYKKESLRNNFCLTRWQLIYTFSAKTWAQVWCIREISETQSCSPPWTEHSISALHLGPQCFILILFQRQSFLVEKLWIKIFLSLPLNNFYWSTSSRVIIAELI